MISTEQGLGLMGEIRNTISPLGGDDLPEWANQQYDAEPKLSTLVRRDQLWYSHCVSFSNIQTQVAPCLSVLKTIPLLSVHTTGVLCHALSW